MILNTKKHGEITFLDPFFQYDKVCVGGAFRLGLKINELPRSLQETIAFSMYCYQAAEIWAIMPHATYVFQDLELMASGHRELKSEKSDWYYEWAKDRRVGASWTSSSGPTVYNEKNRHQFKDLGRRLDLLEGDE